MTTIMHCLRVDHTKLTCRYKNKVQHVKVTREITEFIVPRVGRVE